MLSCKLLLNHHHDVMLSWRNIRGYLDGHFAIFCDCNRCLNSFHSYTLRWVARVTLFFMWGRRAFLFFPLTLSLSLMAGPAH